MAILTVIHRKGPGVEKSEAKLKRGGRSSLASKDLLERKGDLMTKALIRKGTLTNTTFPRFLSFNTDWTMVRSSKKQKQQQKPKQDNTTLVTRWHEEIFPETHKDTPERSSSPLRGIDDEHAAATRPSIPVQDHPPSQILT
jgi:hypothetical protein